MSLQDGNHLFVESDHGKNLKFGIFGSCVSRDTVEHLAPSSNSAKFYVARQSIISARTDATSRFSSEPKLKSRFQARMVSGDVRGSLLSEIYASAGTVDVLLWDLIDERDGVLQFEDGSIVTPSSEMRASGILDQAGPRRHILFGTDEHFGLFGQAARWLKSNLVATGLFARLLVVQVPFAKTTSTAATVSRERLAWCAEVATKANAQYGRYYELLDSLGFPSTHIEEVAVRMAENHQWGLAPYHYDRETYETLSIQIREFAHEVFSGRSSRDAEILSRNFPTLLKVDKHLQWIEVQGGEGPSRHIRLLTANSGSESKFGAILALRFEGDPEALTRLPYAVSDDPTVGHYKYLTVPSGIAEQTIHLTVPKGLRLTHLGLRTWSLNAPAFIRVASLE